MGLWEDHNLKEYPDYFKTKWWKELKEDLLFRRGACCYICYSRVTLLLHHVSYANLFSEKLYKDVYILCFECHNRAHFWTFWGIKVPLKTNWLLLSMRARKSIFYLQSKRYGLFLLWLSIILILLVWNICAYLAKTTLIVLWKLFVQFVKSFLKILDIAITN